MAKKIIAERGLRLEFIVLENDDGKKNYFYMFIRETEYDAFKKAIDKGDPFDLEQYGRVFIQGPGEIPDKEIVAALDELFEDWADKK